MAWNTMGRWAAGAAFMGCILAAGCSPGEEPVEVAFDQARSSMNVAYGAVADEAALVTHRSTQEALFAARRSASDLQEKLSAVPRATELNRLRLEAVRSQMARLDAAILIKSLRSDCDAALARVAPHPKDPAGARSLQRDKDRAFRALDDRLLAAERAYHDACNRLAELLKQESLQASLPVQKL